jgi:hypothetical protein
MAACHDESRKDSRGGDGPISENNCVAGETVTAIIGQSNAAISPDLWTGPGCVLVYAAGGQSLAVAFDPIDGHHYFNALQAMSGYAVDTLIWFQGEADSQSDIQSAAYSENLKILIDRMAADIAPGRMIIIMTSGPFPFNDRVRAAQASAGIPAIDSADLARGDGVHLTIDAQEQLLFTIQEIQ